MEYSLIIPILTILMSGVTSTIVTYTLNARREERDFIREKVEALYLYTHGYCTDLNLAFLDYILVMKGELSLSQVLDLQNKNKNKNKNENKESNGDKVTMLVGIYFPPIKPAFDELMLSRGNVADIMLAFRKSYVQGDVDGSHFLEAYQKEISKLHAAEKSLKSAILNEAEKINKPWWKFW